MKAEVQIQMMDNRDVIQKYVKDSISELKHTLMEHIKK